MRNTKNLSLSLILVSSLILLNCTTVDYVGKTYPGTSHVDVYYSKEEVSNDYEIIGYAVGYKQDYDSIISKIIEEAKTNGADAIVITGIDVEVSNDNKTKKVTASLLKYME